ncbi:MAG TPA: hypothetical protein VHN37_09395 [Actinomycetota bacterium]|nr:hypothetical protein [Actinomycetota bacterium]
MRPGPLDNPEPDVRHRETLPWPWRFVVAGVAFLAVLAPIAPDEPMHLSGVMVVLGLSSAVLAVLSGLVSAARADATEPRSALLAAGCGLLLALGWLAWWVAKLMSDLG